MRREHFFWIHKKNNPQFPPPPDFGLRSDCNTFEARLYRSPYTITHARTYALTYILIFALIFDLTHARIYALTLISAPTHVLAGVLRLRLHRAC